MQSLGCNQTIDVTINLAVSEGKRGSRGPSVTRGKEEKTYNLRGSLTRKIDSRREPPIRKKGEKEI